MAKRMAMSDVDVLRLLSQDKTDYVDYPPLRGDRNFEEDEIDEQALAEMILEQGLQQGRMEALASQGLAEVSRGSQGEYIPNQHYSALRQALEQRLIQQGVDPVQASIMVNRLSEYA